MSASAIPSLVSQPDSEVDTAAIDGRRARVACTSVRLRDFRNFGSMDLDIPPDGVALVGDNGAGKTNLLESLYYLELFRSFRGAPDEQLARFGEAGFHVSGAFDVGSRRVEVGAGYLREGRRKRVRVDGTEPERLGDALGEVGVVVFSPSDLALVSGSPADRRRFLDILLSLNTPGYVNALQRYRHALRQRNALLRSGARGGDRVPWDEALVSWGVPVLAARLAWTRGYASAFAEYCRTVGDGGGMVMRYRSSTGAVEERREPATVGAAGRGGSSAVDADDPGGSNPEDAEEGGEGGFAPVDSGRIEARFREALERRRRREEELGSTVVGPHRDDLTLRLEREDGSDVDLRDFGSGGQRRTAAVALRLVEADTIRARREREPMVLLDDIFAELDAGRGRRLMALLAERRAGQLIVTAPKEVDLGPDVPLARWRIAAGVIAA